MHDLGQDTSPLPAPWVLMRRRDNAVLPHGDALSGHWDTEALTEWWLLKDLGILEVDFYNVV